MSISDTLVVGTDASEALTHSRLQETIVDITRTNLRMSSQNKTLVGQLQAANANFESRVRERTALLAIARDRAEFADHEKSVFLASMSHELRTPLNSILGFTGIVLQGMAGPLNVEQSRQLGIVQNSARHLLLLINDVLDISKIEAGQLECQPESFDVRRSVEQVVASVTPAAQAKSLDIRIQAPAQWGSLFSDRRRVEQILLNLLSNAIKFTDRGGIEISVEFSDQDAPWHRAWAPDASVRFRISDTGIGIDAADFGKLFEPFQQINAGTSRTREGTGLGLSICQGLARLLGGRIVAESRAGAGSSFTLTIPPFTARA